MIQHVTAPTPQATKPSPISSRKERGFTLTEMLVVFALILFIITVVIGNTNKLNKNARVKATAGLVIDTAKDTRSKAISVKQYNSNIFPSYGIHFKTSQRDRITVYADCVADDNGDSIINQSDTFGFSQSSTQCSGSTPNGLVQTVMLDGSTEIKAIRSTHTGGGTTMQTQNETEIDILFLRPEPTIWMVDSSNVLIPNGWIDIDVGDKANTITKTIRFYSTGQFYVI